MGEVVELTIDEFANKEGNFKEVSRSGDLIIFYQEQEHTAWVQDDKKVIGMAPEVMYHYVNKLVN